MLCCDWRQAREGRDGGQDAIGVVGMQPHPFHLSGGQSRSLVPDRFGTPIRPRSCTRPSPAYGPSVRTQCAGRGSRKLADAP